MAPCVVIPTYKNPRTLRAVVLGARERCDDIIVVDDGSPESAASLVPDTAGVRIVTHPTNRGKGAAIRTGLAEAARLGFTHAITMDADGQHLAEDLPRLCEAARARPDALILGARDLAAAGAGRASRFGRVSSNLGIRFATGLGLADTQTGLRCYPVGPVGALALEATGYDLESEVIVKAAWAGIPVTSVPVGARYFHGPDRVSHLDPVRDVARIIRRNTGLAILRICLPASYLALRATRRFQALPWRERARAVLREVIPREPASAGRLALSIALGLFVGIAPLWGAQGALALIGAHLLGLSKPLAFLASNLSFPLFVAPILYASLVLGRLATRGGLDALPTTSLELTRADAPAWIVGSFLLAALVAVAGGIASFACVSTVRWLRATAR